MGRFQIVGSRVIKTGVAIFLTAWICGLLNWPPVFAVITAIVTLEPTVSDSIRKGIVRFPASAIGSAYAVTFIALFGNSPITYTLAAVFTIATCYRLKLHAGLLVATLTSVAMVEVIHSNYLIAFFIRLGTTTIGLLVSTAVNMFVLPPDYTKEIIHNIRDVAKQTGNTLEKIMQSLLNENDPAVNQSKLDKLDKKIMQTERLIRFQREESKYHPLVGSERDAFHLAEQKLKSLRLIHYHMANLMNMPPQLFLLSTEKQKIIQHAAARLVKDLRNNHEYSENVHREEELQLRKLFWEGNVSAGKDIEYPTGFPPDLIVLYELLSIFILAETYHQQEIESEQNIQN
ncbi:aromatic acid exporter family protein [Virgibacillus kimchii]